MTHAEIFANHRDAIRQIIAQHNVENPRLFGSVLHGTADELSDLDILVDPIKGKTTLFDLCGIIHAVQTLTGLKTDVLTPNGLPDKFRNQVLAEAVAI